jgi:hypothetical protein
MMTIMNAGRLLTVVRGAVSTVLVIALLLGGQACAAVDRLRAEPCDPALPVAPWAARLPGAGEPVLGGVTVPSGAALLGRAFPGNDGRTEALLLVTGCDPIGTFRDLVARIERAGFDVTSIRPDGHVCVLDVDGRSHTSTQLPVDSTVPSGARLDRVTCEASGERTAADSGSQPERSVTAGLVVPAGNHGGRPSVIKLRNRSSKHGRSATTNVAIPSPTVPLRPAQLPASAPGEGEKADEFTVVSGSRAVAPPLDPNHGAHIGACSDGALTVLEVTGKPEEIHRRYLQQGLNVYRDDREDVTFHSGSVEVLRFHVRGRRSAMYIETFIEPGRPTYTRIERCVD